MAAVEDAEATAVVMEAATLGVDLSGRDGKKRQVVVQQMCSRPFGHG